MANNTSIIETKEIYTLRYRKTGMQGIHDVNFRANGDRDAFSQGTKFCLKNGYTFVYVKPFITDLETHNTIKFINKDPGESEPNDTAA